MILRATLTSALVLSTACSSWREMAPQQLRSAGAALGGEQLRVAYPARTLALSRGRLEGSYLSGLDATGQLQRLDISAAFVESRGQDFRARFPSLSYELEVSALRLPYVRGEDRSGNTLILDLSPATTVQKYHSGAAVLWAAVIAVSVLTLAVIAGMFVYDPLHIGA